MSDQPQPPDQGKAINTPTIPPVVHENIALKAENTCLRGLLQTQAVEWKCPYGEKVCTIAECSRGFPGCACADDLLTAMEEAGRRHPKLQESD